LKRGAKNLIDGYSATIDDADASLVGWNRAEVTRMSGGMLRHAFCCALALTAPCIFAADGQAVLVAFPGAEGAGAFATGGRGGDVYHVTSLADDGVGTLRQAIGTATGPRTIVFDVGGTINLLSKLNIRKPNITLAGQTAPGNGICITGFHMSTSESGGIQADNTIIRYMRFRVGADPVNAADDSFSINNGNNIIVDHVSASWGSDENLSSADTANNVTVQWSLISESLNAKGHGYGSLIAPETQGARITFHHNLYADNDGRTPRAGSRLNATDFVFDYRNNVNYNWGTQGDWGGWGVVGGNPNEETLDENFINNYSIAGPNTTTSTFRNTAISSNFATSRFYQSGNLIDSDVDHTLDGTDTGWGMFRGTYTKMTSAFPIDPAKAVTTQSAVDAYNSVLADAGANFPVRDAVDTRVIAGVQAQTGRIINTMADIGGFPTGDYPAVSRAAGYDTDLDGMPNSWELLMGLNPNSSGDRNLTNLSPAGYTNLEVFLNGLVAPLIPGDYDKNGIVNAADYVQWSKTDGTQTGYDTWRAHFGQIAGSGSSSSGSGSLAAGTVPEPATSVLMILAAGAAVARIRRRCAR
jgi:pectate lyase